MDEPLRLLTCSEAEADLYAYRRGREQGMQVRIVRGKRCTVLDRCMAEFAAALQFPYCFENTWESFTSSLKDLHWGEGGKVILVTGVQRVLPRAADDFAALMRALEMHRQSGVEVVLHTEARFAPAMVDRVSRAGAKLVVG